MAVPTNTGPAPAIRLTSLAGLVVLALMPSSAAADQQRAELKEDPSRAEIHGRVVDERGSPVAGAMVSLVSARPSTKHPVATSEDGTFRLVLDSPSARFATLLAKSADGARQSIVMLDESNTLARVAEVEVTLSPARRLAVEVVDEIGRPVTGAQVGVIASYQPVADAVTGRTGIASMLIPADAEVDWIFAFKPGAGFDYFENYHAFPTSGRPIPPDAVRLTLRGSRRIEVRILDSKDRPVEGVWLRPWTIQTPGKISYANVSGERLMDEVTDESGSARFNWIPAQLEKGLTFLVIGEAYHCPDSPSLVTDDAGDLLTARILRNARIAGRVLHQDGTPAAGMLLQIEGRGETSHYFRGFARTDRDGRYALRVYPDQAYIVTIISDEWTAASHSGFSLGEEEQRAGVDFELSRGTVIRGKITVGSDAKPTAGETITLIQQGGAAGIGRADDREVRLVRWATTDESGEYRIRVGPGVYELRLPHSTDREMLTIAGLAESDVIRDHHVARRSRGTLRGRVLREDQQPETNALIYGESIGALGHAGFNTVSGADGRFETERWRDDMIVYAKSRDGRRAGFMRISPEADEISIDLRPAAVAVGRVLDSDGKPVEGVRVTCSIETPGIGATRRIQFDTRTDPDGRFRFGGLAIGTRCATAAYHGPERTRTAGAEQEISAPGRFDIGTITIDTRNRE